MYILRLRPIGTGNKLSKNKITKQLIFSQYPLILTSSCDRRRQTTNYSLTRRVVVPDSSMIMIVIRIKSSEDRLYHPNLSPTSNWDISSISICNNIPLLTFDFRFINSLLAEFFRTSSTFY